MGFVSFISGCQMKFLPGAYFIICLLSANPTNLDTVVTKFSLSFLNVHCVRVVEYDDDRQKTKYQGVESSCLKLVFGSLSVSTIVDSPVLIIFSYR